jgi:predicted mannosyl-3-phosphoglycerate phosphatase (HAD superfamily)
MSRRTVEHCGSHRCDAVSAGHARRLATNHLGVRRLAAALVGAKLASRAVIARTVDSRGAIFKSAKKDAVFRAQKRTMSLGELQAGDCAGNHVLLNLYQISIRKRHPENRVHLRAARNVNHNS